MIVVLSLALLTGCPTPRTISVIPVIRVTGAAADLQAQARAPELVSSTVVFNGSEGTFLPLAENTRTPSFRWHTAKAISVKTNAQAWEGTYEALLDGPLREVTGRFNLNFSDAEPSLQILDRIPKDPEPEAAIPVADPPQDVFVQAQWAKAWPHGTQVDWHLHDDCSQLESALGMVTLRAFKPARIAIIDTSFDFKTNPSLQHIQMAECGVIQLQNHTGIGGGTSHGTGTLSILAGATVNVKQVNGSTTETPPTVHGANPHAIIIPIQGASGVAQIFSPLSIVEGLQKAEENNADIVSLSNGGWPSDQEADKLNLAYHHGIVVCAASGNYLTCPFLPLTTPSFVAYPAAYPNCLCVPGITAAQKSYAHSDSWWGWIHDFSHWKMRGNSGPRSLMQRAVCGYSPNVAWAVADSNQVDLDGQGTSAATPQVAGAASLWLEYYRTEIEKLADAKSWQRAELVMHAIQQGAVLPPGAHPDKDKDKVDFDFGLGALKAKNSLGIAPRADWLKNGPQDAQHAADWLTLLLSVAYPRGFRDTPASGAPQTSARSIVESAVQRTFAANRSIVPLGSMKSDVSLISALVNSLNLEAEQTLARSKHWVEWVATYHGSTKDEFAAWRQQLTAEEAQAALTRLQGKDASKYLRAVVKQMQQAVRS